MSMCFVSRAVSQIYSRINFSTLNPVPYQNVYVFTTYYTSLNKYINFPQIVFKQDLYIYKEQSGSSAKFLLRNSDLTELCRVVNNYLAVAQQQGCRLDYLHLIASNNRIVTG